MSKFNKRNNSAVAISSPEKKRKVSQEISQVSQVQVSQVSQTQSQVEVSRKSFEKIINQNQKILQKLEVLLNSQKTLEERMIKLEQVPDGNNEELIKVINIINKND